MDYNKYIHAKEKGRYMKKVLGILLALILILGAGGYFAYRLMNRGSGRVSERVDTLQFISDGKTQDVTDYAMVDGQFYLSVDYIKENLDDSIYYDKQDNIITLANKAGLKRFTPGKSSYSLNESQMELRDPILEKDGKVLLPTEAFIQDYPVDFRYHKESKTMTLDFKDMNYAVGKALEGTLLREAPKSNAPYLTRLTGKEKVIFYGEEGDFYRVRLENGYGGYILKANCKVDFRENKFKSPLAKNEEAQAFEPLHLTWDYTYGNETAARIQAIGPLPGVDVIVPTWFSIKDKEANLIDRGNIDYVNRYRALGIDVWGYIDNSFDPDITHASLTSTKKRQKILRQILALLRKYQMKGINVDFEHVRPEDGPYITQFVQELKALCQDKDIKISVDVTPQITKDPEKQIYDREKLGQAADYLVLMAYDQHWSSSDKAGSVAEYSWVESHLNTLFRTVDKEKIILGVPLYTRLWTEENGKVQSKNISMAQIQEFLAKTGAQPKWDDKIKQYVVDTNQGKIWIEDENSLKYKASLVPKYGLPGLASWRKGFETPNIWPVLDTSIHQGKKESLGIWPRLKKAV